MSVSRRDRWLPIVWSVLLHGAIVAGLGWGVWHFRSEPPPPRPLAIEGTVVDSRALPPAASAPRPADEDRRREIERERAAQLEAQRRAQQEAAERERREIEQRQLEARRAEEERLAAEAQLEAERRLAAEREARAAAERAERERAERQAREEQARREAEAQRLAEAQRREEARRRAEAARAAEEARVRAELEAELRRGIEAEERARAAAESGLREQWVAQITARIQRAWIQPPSATAGLDCTLHMSQVPGGEVVSVRVGECNGDAAVRQSIEAAALRASPLPPPPDPALFERNLVVRFRPRLEAQ